MKEERKKKGRIMQKGASFSSCLSILCSDQDSVKMVAFMLDDLCDPSRIFSALPLPGHVRILNGNSFIAGRLPDSAQRQAAFFCFIRAFFLCDCRVEHDNTG